MWPGARSAPRPPPSECGVVDAVHQAMAHGADRGQRDRKPLLLRLCNRNPGQGLGNLSITTLRRMLVAESGLRG
ncbi:hypothetical protein [Ornithinimicrobium kibberense]|uniref:hypothetical protein n=1 Tax=Ornithinimicrobium kibberense TaxID=282060 RepID=UPI00361C0424